MSKLSSGAPGPVPFDHHSPEHAADPVASYRTVRNDGGVARSPQHGGFTALTRYRDIVEVAKNHEHFSSTLELPGGDGFGGGITLPHNPAASRMSLAEMDPPDWNALRRLLAPTLSAQAVERFVPQIREVTNQFIDGFIEKGHCDLVFDICSPVPAVVTLQYLGLPTEQWSRWAVPIHTSVYTPREPAHPAFADLMVSFSWIFEQIRAAIADRRREPRPGDLMSDLLASDLNGEVMTDNLLFETVYTMLAAGVDTTTSLLSAALRHLSEHTDDRDCLIREPSLLAGAAEEFLRYYSPAQATARTVTAQCSTAGESFRRGDRLLLAWASGNRDKDQFSRPDDFVIDRAPNRHLAFGHGIHRCIGAPLARQEFIVILSEILRRIPDYLVDLEETPEYPDMGLMFGFERMPAVFTPGAVEGARIHDCERCGRAGAGPGHEIRAGVVSAWAEAWEEVIDAVGRDFSDGVTNFGADPIEGGAVRRYLEPLEWDCPLHTDLEAARARGHDDVTAPYTSAVVWSLPAMWSPGDPPLFDRPERNAQPSATPINNQDLSLGPETSGFFATSIELDFSRPLTVGERVGRRGKWLVSCTPKETTVGRGAFLTWESELIAGNGDVVARIRTETYAYQPHPPWNDQGTRPT